LGFEEEYGMSITDYLDDIYAAGVDFAGTKLEHHANTMKRTAEMLKLIDASVHLIRDNYSEGENYFWILYYTYLSPQKLNSVDNIVERVRQHAPHITKDVYYKHRKKAIKTCIIKERYKTEKHKQKGHLPSAYTTTHNSTHRHGNGTK